MAKDGQKWNIFCFLKTFVQLIISQRKWQIYTNIEKAFDEVSKKNILKRFYSWWTVKENNIQTGITGNLPKPKAIVENDRYVRFEGSRTFQEISSSKIEFKLLKVYDIDITAVKTWVLVLVFKTELLQAHICYQIWQTAQRVEYTLKTVIKEENLAHLWRLLQNWNSHKRAT